MKLIDYVSSEYLFNFVVILFIVCLGVFNSPSIVDSFKTQIVDSETNNIDIVTIFTDLESNYSANFFQKYSFINLNGLISKILGKRLMNETVKLDNGYITHVWGEKDMKLQANRLNLLGDFLAEKDIQYVYIQAPTKIKKNDKQLPPGVFDYTNENIDKLLELLDDFEVDNLNLQEEITKDGFDHYSSFFMTDHHWKPRTGFWAFTKIAQFLETKYGYEIDNNITDINNYNIGVCKKCLLGGDGKRTGIYYAGIDDLELIYPKFATDLSLEIPSKNIKRTGDFDDVIFDRSQIDKKDLFTKEQYTTYIGGNYPLVLHRNLYAVNDKKILIVRDSFSSVVQPYLSLLIKEVDVIDLRYVKDSSLRNYVQTTMPDLVLVMYSPDLFTNEKILDFGL